MSFDSFYIILGLLAVASAILALAFSRQDEPKPPRKNP